jgi:hypothetical protein
VRRNARNIIRLVTPVVNRLLPRQLQRCPALPLEAICFKGSESRLNIAKLCYGKTFTTQHFGLEISKPLAGSRLLAHLDSCVLVVVGPISTLIVDPSFDSPKSL